METKRRTLGTTVLQLALGLLFIVSGIWTLQSGNGDEVAGAIRSIFSGDAAKILCIVFGIIEILAGAFLLLRLFVPLATNIDTLLLLIIMICWIACIVLVDFMGSKGILKSLDGDFLAYLNRLARHLLILGALIKVRF